MVITLDGRACPAIEGQTVLEVARENGIWIPSLCWHPRTGRTGRCRACLVEVEGFPSLKEACGLLVRDGMAVNTTSEKVMSARRMVVELLLAQGHHDCLSCEANGRCELQDMAWHLGIERPSFRFDVPIEPVDDSSPGVLIDRDRCIQCGRCVTGCQDLVVHEVLGFENRGHEARLVCDDDRPMGSSTCVQCGECVQLCPVGALVFRPAKGKARSWELSATKVTCPYCGVGCQIDLLTRDDRIVSTAAHMHRWREQPNQGMLCVKGRFGLDFVDSPERLSRPLLRKGEDLVEVSWDEALDYVASGLARIREASGPDAVGFCSSAKCSNEENYAFMRFARGVIGTNNIDHCARL
jgi:predicted molibdopterin-dependent oxidoreductase YjgC